jgi:hypothetical protein
MFNKMFAFVLLFNLSTRTFAQENWDTTFYVSCKNRLSLGLVVSERSYNIDISADTGSATAINFDTEARNAIGFIADFDKLALKLLFKTKEKLNERKGNTRNSNFFLGIGSNKFLFEGSYRFFKGFYDETSGNYIPQFNDTTPYFKSSGMSANLIKAKIYYFTNHNKFAYKSVYSCGFRQLRSSFSGVLTANFMNERIMSDSSMIPALLQNEYGNSSTIKGLSHTGFGVGAGLTGTLVFFKRFFANLLFVPSLHAQQRHYHYLNKKGTSGYYATLLLDTRVSLGYNAERFFLLVTGTNDRHWIKGKGVNIQPSFISGTFILGYRFNVANNGWLKKVRSSGIYKKI